MKLRSEFPRVTLKIWKNGKCKRLNRSTRFGRINYLIKSSYDKIYIKVEYGKAKTNTGKTEMFYNDGEYTNNKDAHKAYLAFIEMLKR
jgi:hypothetical protein